MSSKTLSMFPYYGGKARMASFICNLLNYDDSDIFVTPFGGACRVLLNKPRHKVEVYNDLSEALCTFVEQMSNRDTAIELIHRIYKTEYSQEQFDWALNIRNSVDDSFLKRTNEALIYFLKEMLIKYDLMEERGNIKTLLSIVSKKDTQVMKQLKEKMSESEWEKLVKLNADNIAVKEALEAQGSLDSPRNSGVLVSDIDLAVATYVVYIQSRDGMGTVWSGSRFKSTDAYRRQMKRLYDVAERLEGVQVNQIDAMDFFQHYFDSEDQCQALLESANPGDISYAYYLMNKWITNPRVMMFCDPSYIDPVVESKILATAGKANNTKAHKNLGKVYKASFEYEQQEKFVYSICHARCKMVVCNYDIELYNRYLTPANGWKRVEFETTTSVGGKKNNRRKEVVWYNY